MKILMEKKVKVKIQKKMKMPINENEIIIEKMLIKVNEKIQIHLINIKQLLIQNIEM